MIDEIVSCVYLVIIVWSTHDHPQNDRSFIGSRVRIMTKYPALRNFRRISTERLFLTV